MTRPLLPGQRRTHGGGVLRAAAVTLVAAALTLPLGALPAVADEVREKQYWLESYGITDAWATTQGEGVKVAIIDSGVDGTHPDLAGAVTGGTDASGAGSPGGQLGIGEVPVHGTLVGTLLAGRGHQGLAPVLAPGPEPTATSSPAPEPSAPAPTAGSAAPGSTAEAGPGPEPSVSGESPAPSTSGPTADAFSPEPVPPPAEQAPGPLSVYGSGPDGIVGVAPKAELLAVSVWIDGPNSGPNPAGVGINDQIPTAVRWAVDNGAKVINMSLGSTSTTWPESWDEAFLYAEQQDVVIVAAAGNRAGGLIQVGAPATIPGVLSVAGLDRSGVASREASSEGISIAVAAPSEDLVGGLPGGGYAEWSGTSGAAPLVSGVAALIRSKYPELSAAQVVNRIVATARDTGAPGFDTLYGYGVLDVAAAVNADISVPEANRLGSMADWIQVYRRSEGGSETPAPGPEAEEAAPDIPEPPVPQAEEPGSVPDNLAATVVLGFTALFAVLLTAGTVHVLRTRRK
ncbi:subtilisin family serine protease [Arthrobacter sp. CAN_A6]|uniref:S8 family serine peptidase n=1 Tax=Arthrobacter sp. CAN_A6 TaxID=2787721 RepID=UPI0018CACD5E